MPESSVQKRILASLGGLKHVRLWRNNVGKAWMGKAVKLGAGAMRITSPRMVRFGLCPGSSDLIGITTVEVTPDMVGKKVGLFTAIEVKGANTRVQEDQERYVELVRSRGGIAGVVRGTDQALRLLDQATSSLPDAKPE